MFIHLKRDRHCCCVPGAFTQRSRPRSRRWWQVFQVGSRTAEFGACVRAVGAVVCVIVLWIEAVGGLDVLYGRLLPTRGWVHLQRCTTATVRVPSPHAPLPAGAACMITGVPSWKWILLLRPYCGRPTRQQPPRIAVSMATRGAATSAGTRATNGGGVPGASSAELKSKLLADLRKSGVVDSLKVRERGGGCLRDVRTGQLRTGAPVAWRGLTGIARGAALPLCRPVYGRSSCWICSGRTRACSASPPATTR